MPRIGIVAGESSGDQLGAALMRELREMCPDVEIIAMAGPKMRAEGCHEIARAEDLSVMGIVEVLKKYPQLRQLRERLVGQFSGAKLDAFVGIDVPDFVINIESRLRQQGIPSCHYVAPQVWAWRPKRAMKLAKSVDLLLTLFPFEPKFFAKYGVNAVFAGHPLVEEIPEVFDRSTVREKLGLAGSERLISLLPGSRHQEWLRHTELFIRTAEQLNTQLDGCRFVVGAVNERAKKYVSDVAFNANPDIDLTVKVGKSHELLMASDAALAVSGTVTMEALCAQVPTVVAIKVAPVTYAVLRRLITTPYIAMPNIIAGEEMMPEFVQGAATSRHLSGALKQWLENNERRLAYKNRCRAIRGQLSSREEFAAASAILRLAGA